MRLILTFLILLIFDSCKTIPDTSESFSKTQTIANCPKDGICSIEILKNTELILKKDEFGSLYPHLQEGNFIVIKFEYVRNEILNTVDSAYRELIYLQLYMKNLEFELHDNNLSDIKLLYGRLCFCLGQTGYYRINSGNFSINFIAKNTYQINLDFKSLEVPQVISNFRQEITLE